MRYTTLSIVLAISLATAAYTGFLYGEAQPAKGERPQVHLIVDPEPLNRSDSALASSYADILERVIPAVVSVRTSRKVQMNMGQRGRGGMRGPAEDPSYNPLEEFLRRFYGLPEPQGDEQGQGSRRSNAPVERTVPSGMGSGFIVTQDGYILTNHHIIAGRDRRIADEIVVQLGDGREYTAEVVGSDPQTDVAVLKISGEDLPYATIADSDQLRVGDVVFAIGNPLEVGLTVTQGIISATDRTNLGILGMEGYENFIQTDAAINFGNSGGPLVDAQGRVIGINTAILSRTGGNIGIGFAIPVNLASGIMTSLVERGEVRRGFLGIDIRNVDRELAAAMGLASTRGALVNSVEAGLPAAEAGIRHGDVLTEVNGVAVNSASDLRFLISRMEPGSEVKLKLIRAGEEKEVTVTLGDRDELVANLRGGTGPIQGPLLDGVQLQQLDAELREQYSIPQDLNGLAIIAVDPFSPYDSVLTEGMVIVEVNRQPVATAAELRQAVQPGQSNLIWVYYRGRYSYIPLVIR